MRPRLRRHCCRMHVASRRQSISRCPLRFCNVNCTPSVQHDVMAIRRWTKPCVLSRAQSASSESDSDTLLTIALFLLFGHAAYIALCETFNTFGYVSDWYLHEIQLTLGSAIHIGGNVRVWKKRGNVRGEVSVEHVLHPFYCYCSRTGWIKYIIVKNPIKC